MNRFLKMDFMEFINAALFPDELINACKKEKLQYFSDWRSAALYYSHIVKGELLELINETIRAVELAARIVE